MDLQDQLDALIGQHDRQQAIVQMEEGSCAAAGYKAALTRTKKKIRQLEAKIKAKENTNA